MSISNLQQTYTIKEAAALTGLPASTLRYYESIGVIAPVNRGESSKHRVYTEQDLDQVLGVACLAAVGMPISDMRRYVENSQSGSSGAADQVALLMSQKNRLAAEVEFLKLRQRYVDLKISYWQAVEAGDAERVDQLLTRGRLLADELKRSKPQ